MRWDEWLLIVVISFEPAIDYTEINYEPDKPLFLPGPPRQGWEEFSHVPRVTVAKRSAVQPVKPPK